MKEYVPIFFDWVEVTGELNAQEKGRLIDAIVLYAQGGDWQEQIKGNERYLFPAFRKQIDRASEISDLRSKATESRRNQSASKDIKGNQTQSNDIKQDQTESKPIKTPNNNNNKEEKEEYNENNKEKVKRESRRFAPPTREEVAAYIAEKGYRVDPDRWLAYYESNGWKVGKNPMKDWRAAVRTWASNGVDASPAKNTTVQSSYAQRQYEERKPNQLPQWLLDMEAEERGEAVI